MKNKAPRSSMVYRFVLSFVILVVMPILLAWFTYERVLNYYYADNRLAVQQINLGKSVDLLETTFNAVENMFVALEENYEVTYYLDYRSAKSDMFYATFKRIHQFCEGMHQMSSYLEELNIYCDSPLVIYAGPFVKRDKLVADEVFEEKLEKAGFREIVWRVIFPDGDEEQFPAIYAYKKLYAPNYMTCIGYMEVQLSSELMKDYFDIVTSLSDDDQSVLTLYCEEEPIYSTSQVREERIGFEDREPGYALSFFRNKYENFWRIPKLDMWVVRSGKLRDINVLPFRELPSVLFSVILMLLLISFLIFFMSIVAISRRIFDFSLFIRCSNPELLSQYQPDSRGQRRTDELDELIGAYNSLIQENNSLISQIQRMELFTRDAKYRALQDQIHPHFIYGTLETIRMMALQNKDKAVSSMIFSLAALIRYSMSISTKAVTLKDELEIARHYLQIQRVRFGERVEYSFQVEESLLGLEMPSFILQPILENAIIYGVSQTLEVCTVRVEVFRENGDTVMRVCNNGALITPQRLEEVNRMLAGEVSAEGFSGNRNGVALYNIRERVGIFFGGRATIRLELTKGYTMTVIRIKDVGEGVNETSK